MKVTIAYILWTLNLIILFFSASAEKNDTKRLPLFVGRKEVEEMTQSGIHILLTTFVSSLRVLGHSSKR